jgi:hypothetical protein
MKNPHPLCVSSVIFILLSFWSTESLSQSREWFGEVWGSPLLISLGNQGVREYGTGYYDFNFKQGVAQEYGISIGRRFASHWETGIGISRKNIHQQFGFELRDPMDENRILDAPARSYQYNFFGLRAFGGYTWERHSLRLIVELNDPYQIRLSPEVTWFYTQRFFSSQGQKAEFTVEERLTPNGSHIIPEINYGYQLYENFFLSAGVKWRWYGDDINYRLLITGNTFEMPEPETILNDTRILDRFFMVYAGARVRVGWRKR